MTYYHGSPVAGIETLTPPPGGPLYLTDCRAYALFYIRDLEVNWVTCGVRDGVVVYDEQFPGQLRVLYEGRAGWLYACEGDFAPGNSPWIVTAYEAIAVSSTAFIPDAYEAILREIDAGTVRIDSYESKTEAYRRERAEGLARHILKNGWLRADTAKARFVEQHFPEAWALALEREHPVK